MNNIGEKSKKVSYDIWAFPTNIRFIIAILVAVIALLYKLGILNPS